MPLSKDGFLLLSRVYLTTLTTVESVIYGLIFALYILCARSLYLQLKDQDRRKQHLFTILYMTLAMALALINLAVDAQDIQTSYVDHADYPGGGLLYSNNVFDGSSLNIMDDTALILSDLMMSGIQIWRLWIVWKASRYSLLIVISPVLSLLTFIGFETAGAIMTARSDTLTSHLAILLSHGQLIPQLYISVSVTVLIITRIIMVRWKHARITGQTNIINPYMSIISMLIESFALESVWIVVQLSTFSLSEPAPAAASVFFTNTQPFIHLLAYLLVVYRVTTGRGWKEDTEEKLTTLQWNRDGLQTTHIGTRTSVPITYEEA